MTHKLNIEKPRKISRAIPLIESKIKIKINLRGNTVFITGKEYNEYIVEKVLEAVDFGFEADDALLLLNESFNLEYINIKEHSRRKNLTDVRARIIGKGGKAMRTIEELTGGVLVLNANTIGFIVDEEHLSHATQAIISLIQGSKHGNVFSYLEKQNAKIRILDKHDLGLK